VLSPAEQRTLAAWAAAGAPAGRARALPVPAANTAPRGSRVLTLQPRRAYTPRAADGGLDDYRCFLLDPKLRRDTFVTGALIRPQQAGIVHHVILFEAAGAQAAAATALDRRSGGKGWTCFGGPGLPIDLSSPNVALRFGSPQWIAAWVPGHVTNDLPRGLGVRLHRGAKIVMQVHYNLMHGARPDRSRAVLTTAPRGAKLQPLETMLTAAPVELPCPGGARGPRCSRAHEVADAVARFGFQGAALPEALLQLCGKTLADYPRAVGDGRSISTSCDRRIDRPMTVRSVAGHMHLRGREISLVLDPGTPRERTLLHIPRWDFHWQDAYYLRDPVRLRPGDRIRLSCTFDNSAAGQPALGSKPLAPRYVLWGEGTTDEMCLGLLAVTLG
jgi:hypothetical protein